MTVTAETVVAEIEADFVLHLHFLLAAAVLEELFVSEALGVAVP